ncbi:DapH/DapD/GlmU-related protein [Leptospira santarosai]|uniref:DapH/DapD/GlmU-related protein n=1 Tax=Leptospira santarosai TaxID=28183 RepID=UPI0002BDA77B|nr:DapH/DapD/GlmU-related protein [Leptospira santarosai]ASV10810.1 transferase [Leptospira santarosai]EMP04023.1 transferase hexapeptide repeat protein [Leptospira santarosai str. HAI1380]KXZ31668.1 transferase [Leptospira santarosai]MBW9232587.1 transferase [Leptospira santarosai]MDI7174395.1 DapH/DapD/GlmU-related protein [Leptospira santarosai]
MSIVNILKKYNALDLIVYLISELYVFYVRFSSGLMLIIKSKIWCVRIEKGSSVFGKIIFYRFPGSVIRIGENFTSISNSFRASASTIFSPTRFKTLSPSAKILIGNDVGVNGLSITARSKSVIIGNGVMFAPNVTIMDSSFHALWPPEGRLTNPDFESDDDVVIGNNVWLGSQVIVLKGVKIGNNSVIGAGSIVTKSIPENCLAVGNPAKPIRFLNQTKEN